MNDRREDFPRWRRFEIEAQGKGAALGFEERQGCAAL
jgi:hypothetical protein